MGTDSDKELGPNSIEGGGPECKAEQRKKPQAFFSFSGGRKEDQSDEEPLIQWPAEVLRVTFSLLCG